MPWRTWRDLQPRPTTWVTQPAGRSFQGDSTTQASRSAAWETRGLILSYDGGIVESLYASNAHVSAEAHGHLGASMSQTGAQQLGKRTPLQCNPR